MPVWQSATTEQPVPAAQSVETPRQLPPQSTPVSEAFCTVSVQVGLAHVLPLHTWL